MTVAERARLKACVFDVFDLMYVRLELNFGGAQGRGPGRRDTRAAAIRSEIEIWHNLVVKYPLCLIVLILSQLTVQNLFIGPLSGLRLERDNTLTN